MWLLASMGAHNLHPGVRGLVEIVLVAVALVSGGIAGGLIGRHRDDAHPILFAVTAGAVSGALCGATYAVVMGIGFVSTFGGAPVSFTDGLVLALAYPVFAALGALSGSVPGMILGGCGGFLATRRRSVASLVR
jgi:hypothetical protein